MIDAICKEIELQKNYIPGDTISTIYFGGGTPSVLNGQEIEMILSTIVRNFPVDAKEITLEANPDDLTIEKILDMQHAGISRLSIGIQSFFDEDLRWMNRAHSSAQAFECLELAQSGGFENISADLIYGIPEQSDERWKFNVQQLIERNISHISCYALTVEPETALFHSIEKKKMPPPDEDQAAKNFYTLIDLLTKNKYEHYEISNFAKEKKYAQHNSSYWKGEKYLGIGPSAHSFNGISRQWNVANNALYIQNIEQENLPAEIEVLTPENLLNEKIMTSLRTQWGLALQVFRKEIGEEDFLRFRKAIDRHIQKGNLEIQNERLLLTQQAKFFADGVISDLFFTGQEKTGNDIFPAL